MYGVFQIGLHGKSYLVKQYKTESEAVNSIENQVICNDLKTLNYGEYFVKKC